MVRAVLRRPEPTLDGLAVLLAPEAERATPADRADPASEDPDPDDPESAPHPHTQRNRQRPHPTHAPGKARRAMQIVKAVGCVHFVHPYRTRRGPGTAHS